MPEIPEPAERLAPQARWAWRLSWVGGWLVAMLVASGVAGDLPDGWGGPLMAVLVVALLAGAVVVPELRWRRWRWEVREHEIDLERGLLVVRRTLIPMERVQHVETERGVIGQLLGLATVEIHTAAGSHAIPLLRDADAGRLRERIAELARTRDEDAGRPDEDAGRPDDAPGPGPHDRPEGPPTTAAPGPRDRPEGPVTPGG